MDVKKVEISDNGIYSSLVKIAARKGIHVYEVEGPQQVKGIYYDYTKESIKAKVIMINRYEDKEYTLAYFLQYIRLCEGLGGHIYLKEKSNKGNTETTAESRAERLISLIRWQIKRSRSKDNK